MNVLQELWAMWSDVICCGDLVGHLRAWWRVVQGQVDVETQIVPTGTAGADIPPAPAAAVAATSLRMRSEQA